MVMVHNSGIHCPLCFLEMSKDFNVQRLYCADCGIAIDVNDLYGCHNPKDILNNCFSTKHPVRCYSYHAVAVEMGRAHQYTGGHPQYHCRNCGITWFGLPSQQELAHNKFQVSKRATAQGMFANRQGFYQGSYPGAIISVDNLNDVMDDILKRKPDWVYIRNLIKEFDNRVLEFIGEEKMPDKGPGGIPWNYYIALLEFAKALQSKDRPAANIDKDGWLKVTYPEFVVKVKISEITVEPKG